MTSAKWIVLIALCMGTGLDCRLQITSRNRSRRAVGHAASGSRSSLLWHCEPLVGVCPCGENRNPTTIRLNRCYSRDKEGKWVCNPCGKRFLCDRLENCLRCDDNNPAAICAECPRNRVGTICQFSANLSDAGTTMAPTQRATPPRSDTEMTSSQAGGLRFGNNPYSRQEFSKMPSRIRIRSEFSLEFKTTASSGLLFYAADTKHIDSLSLYMVDGQINYRFNCGTGPANISSEKTYNDGQWHKVVFIRVRRLGKLTIDGDMVGRGESSGPTRAINVNPPYFVGGIAEEVAEAISAILGAGSVSFPGCIRAVKLRNHDLTDPSYVDPDVQPCSNVLSPTTEPLPQCTEIPQSHGARLTAESDIKDIYIQGDQLHYECLPGYRPVSPSLRNEMSLRCEEGKWSGTQPSCEPVPQCTDIPQHHGARLTADSAAKTRYFQGEQLHYECRPGFRPVHSAKAKTSLTCYSGHSWLGVPPSCELHGCEKFTVDGGNVSYGLPDDGEQYIDTHTSAHVQCHEDYDLVSYYDNGTTTCTPRLDWEPAKPRCRKKCVSPPNILCNVSTPETARADADVIHPGESVRFRCKDGFYRRLSTPTERICLLNGTLSGADIQCIDVIACNITKLKIPPSLEYCCLEEHTGRCLKCENGRELDLPDAIVHGGTRLQFSCRNEQHYELIGSHKVMLCGPFGFVGRRPSCRARCGLRPSPTVARVMGGRRTRITEWPWQAGVFQVNGVHGQFLCGGVLISEQWVLTAAHCLTVDEHSTAAIPQDELKVIYGTDDITSERLGSVRRYSVSDVVFHYGYNNTVLSNDIALLKLKESVIASHTVGVACLPCAEQRLAAGDVGVVTGWGWHHSELREVWLTVAEDEECKRHLKALGYSDFDTLVTKDTFCGVSNTTTDDASAGDSGGPFVVQTEDGRWVLQGLVSWGLDLQPSQYSASSRRSRTLPRVNHENVNEYATWECEGKACYGGYVKVASYVQWIGDRTGMIVCGN